MLLGMPHRRILAFRNRATRFHVPRMVPRAMALGTKRVILFLPFQQWQSAASRYPDQGEGNAGGVIPHHWYNTNPTGATCVYTPPHTSNSQPNGMADLGPTPAANVHPAAGMNAQPYAPVSSESLRSLARRLILDLGTRVSALNIEASRTW
ncbi:hypothetical protein BJY52DRAFT_1193307 [Lactarius psammicola]|nr:hypothetical protein BJY52DRAFT_1193307 [Lactarius psammicola]